jgi:hypothetical protein
MNSRILLKIEDPKLNKDYLLSRKKEILVVSSLILISRLAIFLAAIISAVTNQRTFVFH